MKSNYFILFIILSGVTILPQTPFVAASDSGFVYQGSRYSFVGVNAYYLQRSAADSNTRYIVDEVFERVSEYGFKVVRTWAFNSSDYGTMREGPYLYDESGLEALDYVLFKAEQHNIKVILCLENYYADLGGIPAYIQWAQGRFPEKSFLRSDFFIDDTIRQWYKHHLSIIVNRKNSYTKVHYKDDPVIFAWELMNEAENEGSSTHVLLQWYDEMSNYLNELDPLHLISTGETGYDNTGKGYADIDYFYNSNHFLFNGTKGNAYSANTQIKNIDYGSYHLYPEVWNLSRQAGWHWIRDHNSIAFHSGKPALLGEYGVTEKQGETYRYWLNKMSESGIRHSILWQYVHPDFNGGDDFGVNELTHSALMQFLKVYADSLASPSAPVPLPGNFTLYQNYPNPFNPVTVIRYDLTKPVFIKLELFLPDGQKLKTLDEGWKEAGRYEITLSLSEDFLPSGVYLYRLQAGEFSVVKGAVLLK